MAARYHCILKIENASMKSLSKRVPIIGYFLTHTRELLLLVFLFCMGYVLVARLDYPPHGDDMYRDYVIARNIVLYHEYPLVGPVMNAYAQPFGAMRNSPVYYYVLSLPLLFYDHVLALGIFGILLQLITIVFFYILGSFLWSKKIGCATAVLYGVASLSFHEYSYPWQPQMMEPFFILSLILCAITYKKRTVLNIVMTGVVVCAATLIHVSAVLLVPLYIYVLAGAPKKKLPIGFICTIGIICNIAMIAFLYALSPHTVPAAYQQFYVFPHRFTPALLLGVCLLGNTLYVLETVRKKKHIAVAMFAICLIALPFVDRGVPIISGMKHPFRMRQQEEQIETVIIKRTINSIMMENYQMTPNFFLIYSYFLTKQPTWYDASVWLSLEKTYSRRFLYNNDSELRNYSSKNDDIYVFIICNAVATLQDEQTYCVDPFIKEHIAHLKPDRIYGDGTVSIFLSKRKE